MEFITHQTQLVVDPEQIDIILDKLAKIEDAFTRQGIMGPKWLGIRAYKEEYERKTGVKLGSATIYQRARRGDLESRKDGGTRLFKLDL